MSQENSENKLNGFETKTTSSNSNTTDANLDKELKTTKNVDFKTSFNKKNTTSQNTPTEEPLIEQVVILNAKIKELQEQLNQQENNFNNQLLKNQAELINFKKRIQLQKTQEVKYASSNFISDLLIPLEQLEKVLEMSTDNELLKKYLSGFQMIQQQIQTILKAEGVEEIKALGEIFDPNLHHALETVSNSQKPNKTNLLVLQKGYSYKEKILRPAMVQVNEWREENGESK